MLSALGRHHGWSRAELEGLTAADADFWCDAMVRLHEAGKPKDKTT